MIKQKVIREKKIVNVGEIQGSRWRGTCRDPYIIISEEGVCKTIMGTYYKHPFKILCYEEDNQRRKGLE